MKIGEFAKALTTIHRITVKRDSDVVADFYSNTVDSLDEAVLGAETERIDLVSATASTNIVIELKATETDDSEPPVADDSEQSTDESEVTA